MSSFKDDMIMLSNGFFQDFLSNAYDPGVQPTLQIIEFREMPGAAITRLRLSDGLFSYGHCAGSMEIGRRLEQEGYKDSRGIIQITEFIRSQVGDKIGLSIINFKCLQLTDTTIGSPKPHSGNPDDFKGIENYAQFMNTDPNSGLPVSRKRSHDDPLNGGTPSKQTNLPSGGVFSDGLIDIAMITPYVNRFRVVGSVTFKEDPRNINTKRGQSKVFSFTLTDTLGNSIKVTGFGRECDRFADLVQEGQAYYITCVGSNIVREANKRFNSTGHTYEISLNGQCDIELCQDRDLGVPACKLNTISLLDIKNHSNLCVDVLAAIDKVEDITTVLTKKDQKNLSKRNVTLIDDSCTQVQLTLWDNAVNKITPENIGEIFGFKGLSVREFNGGFSLSLGMGASIIPAPDSDRTSKLFEWYHKVRPTAQVGTLSAGDSGASFERECRLINSIKETNLDYSERGIFVIHEAFINSIRTENIAYTACPNEGCKKKVSAESNQWNCSVCGLQDSYRYLYMVNLEIADLSGLTWTTLFDEAAISLFGKKADELMELQQNNREEYDNFLQSFRFKTFEFRMRVKSETYNDQKRLRWSCISIRPTLNTVDRYIKAINKTISVIS